MPPKAKKQVLKDEDIETTIALVKQYWPEYHIIPEMIKNPSRDLVLQLYTKCIENIEHKIAYATRTDILPEPPGLEVEQLLFLKLSRIQPLIQTDFKVGDLYKFDPFRVKNHIYIIMHYMIFIDTIMYKTMAICRKDFDTKENMKNNEEKLKELKEEKLQKQIKLTQIKSENEKLQDEAAILTPQYEETLTLIQEAEKKIRDKALQVEKLLICLENVQEEVQKLQKTEAFLQTQIVTETEYLGLKNAVESLEYEDKNLEEIDINNGLQEQKQIVDGLQMCLPELNHLEDFKHVSELSKLEIQLNDLQQSSKGSLKMQKSSEVEIKALKTQLENAKLALEIDNKELQERLRIVSENALLEEATLNKKYKKMSKENQMKIEEIKRKLELREDTYKQLRTVLTKAYNKVPNIQDSALQKVENFMKKINEL